MDVASKLRNQMLAAGLLSVVCATGCTALSTLTWVITGPPKVPAAFADLKGQRVAVVCISDSAAYSSPNSAPAMLAGAVTDILRLKVDDIEVVRPDEIADWMDHNDWGRIDYREIGAGVKADKVVVVELRKFSLHEDKTLYKGRADYDVKVYDMTAGGAVVWSKNEEEFAFPRTAAIAVTEINETRFSKQFVFMLADRISRYFYAYPLIDDYAPDSVATS